MAIYCLPEDLEKVEEALRKHALADSPNEKGAQENRFDAFPIDFEKGGATAYLVKYLTKNIAGCGGMENEIVHESEVKGQKEMYVPEGQERVEAWATCWGIRQFQFFGCPPVTVWRELRRVDDGSLAAQESLAGAEKMAPEEREQFKEIRSAAIADDWKGFVLKMGGPAIPRNEYPLKSWREPEEEINGYYEIVEAMKGVAFSCAEKVRNILTRFLVWTIRPAKLDADREAGTASPWTRVNNCTEAIVPGAG